MIDTIWGFVRFGDFQLREVYVRDSFFWILFERSCAVCVWNCFVSKIWLGQALKHEGVINKSPSAFTFIKEDSTTTSAAQLWGLGLQFFRCRWRSKNYDRCLWCQTLGLFCGGTGAKNKKIYFNTGSDYFSSLIFTVHSVSDWPCKSLATKSISER